MRLRQTLRAVILGLAGLMPHGGALAQQETGPVVVELFTSQGCSSCPPADALLHELAGREDVIALALHVDYWDYIGWKDVFALPGHTERQKGYAQAGGRRMIYTPQMVIDGTDHVVGNQPLNVAKLISTHTRRARVFDVAVEKRGQKQIISLTPLEKLKGDFRILLVDYEPSATVEILRGENAGRTLTYANVVRGWQELGRWDGAGEFTAEVGGDATSALLVQEAEFGPILAARDLR